MTTTTPPPPPPPPPPLREWSSTQGHILTGGGRLNELMLPGRDYGPEDLPHAHKARGLSHCRQVFREWAAAGRRSRACVGAWRRPLFAGGWDESTEADTAVYNLQTPSIFVDLRFPRALTAKRFPASLADCSLDQLRDLSQQHCFAGYSIVDERPAGANTLPVCVRHHALDWNYHPSFPRARPNIWRVEAHPAGDGRAFKEWGYAQDPQNSQAVYFERWALLPGRSRGPCLALRRTSGPRADRDAFLLLLGEHFAYAEDRRHPMPAFTYAEAGGCARLAQAAYERRDRAALEALLDMEGSYGRVDGAGAWTILQSTHPWRRGRLLFQPGDLLPVFQGEGADRTLSAVEWKGATWEVLECELEPAEFTRLTGAPRARL